MNSPLEGSDTTKKHKKFKKNKSNRSGVDYEMGLLMLFLKRAEENHYKFELGAELADSEKFDDLYFKDYTTEKRVYFLQAKHKDNVSKLIQFDDLNSQSDTDFSLLKYFNSYRKIKKKQEFQNDLDTTSFILCTTISFDSHAQCLNNSKSVRVIEVKENDGIFKTDKRELGKRFKLKIDDAEEREEILKNSYSSLKTMANKLAECIIEEKNINIDQISSIRRYHVALAEHVIDERNKNFRSEFLSNQEGLTENAKKFRGIFYNSVQEYLKRKTEYLQTLHAKERKKAERILKEFQIDLCGAKNEMLPDNLGNILKAKKLKLVGIFGKLQLHNSSEVIKKLCHVLNDSEQNTVEVTKSTSFGRSLRKLGGYVLFIENGEVKFNEEFLKNEQLPNSFREFRKQLKETLGEKRFCQLATCKLNFIFETQDDSKRFEDKIYWDLEDDSTSDEVMDSEVNEFLEKLLFIITPKSVELKTLIENEMKEEFGPRGENILGLLNTKVLYWMHHRDEEGHGYYLSHKNNIYTESKKQCLGSTWFRMKNTVKLFTGRKSQLEKMRCSINKGTLVINGLSGVGKTELALKYVHEEYSKEDNVIWVNADTQESATESFRTLYKQLGFKLDDEHGERKSIKVISEGLYGYFSDANTLFIFDNAENLSVIEEFLPQVSSSVDNTLRILLTSPNSLEWKSSRHNIETMHLDDFTDSEAIKFVEKALTGVDENPEDIIKLTKKLYKFPLALDQAVTYIRDENEERQARGFKFSVREYLEKYEQAPQPLLNVELPPDSHVEGTNKTLNLIFKKIANNEKYGKKALRMLSIMSYFSQNNIPEQTFLAELADGDFEKLTPITRLLKKYSTVGLEEGMLRIHGLVQQVRRLDLEGEHEKEVLQTALKLLKQYVATRSNVEAYVSHIISVWKYASQYDNFIYDFIVKDIVESIELSKTKKKAKNAAEESTRPVDDVLSNSDGFISAAVTRETSYLHVLAGGIRYEVFYLILNKIKTSLSGPKMLHSFVNTRDESKKTFLHYAAEGGDVRIVDLLIENKANIDTRDRIDNRPLHLAAKHGHLAVVTTLIEKKANVNAVTSPNFEYTPLHFAAQNGHLDVVEVLLNRNAEVNSQTAMGFTPLHLASLKGYLDIVESLLNKNADINMETNEKYTALHFAVKNGCLDVVDLLLERGANINALDNKNFTPLHWAALSGSENIVNCLLKNSNVDVKIESTENKTALRLAEEKGHFQVIAALNEKVNE